MMDPRISISGTAHSRLAKRVSTIEEQLEVIKDLMAMLANNTSAIPYAQQCRLEHLDTLVNVNLFDDVYVEKSL